MANGRHRGKIVDKAIVAGVALIDKSAEAILSETVIIAREIVPTHLIDYDAYDQLRLLAKKGLRKGIQ
jgi:hypothetical protein